MDNEAIEKIARLEYEHSDQYEFPWHSVVTRQPTLAHQYREIAHQILRALKQLGYRKLSGEPPLLSPEERRDAFERAESKCENDRREDVYEFNFLWQYVAYEVAKAERQLCIKWVRGE